MRIEWWRELTFILENDAQVHVPRRTEVMEGLQEGHFLALEHKPGGVEVLDVLGIVEGPCGRGKKIAVEQLARACVRVQSGERRVARPGEQAGTIATVPAKGNSSGNEARGREDGHDRVVHDHGLFIGAFPLVDEGRRAEQRLQKQVEACADQDLGVGECSDDIGLPALEEKRNTRDGSSRRHLCGEVHGLLDRGGSRHRGWAARCRLCGDVLNLEKVRDDATARCSGDGSDEVGFSAGEFCKLDCEFSKLGFCVPISQKRIGCPQGCPGAGARRRRALALSSMSHCTAVRPPVSWPHGSRASARD